LAYASKLATPLNNKAFPNFVGIGFVPRTGFEPAHPFRLYHLKVACLPISPPGLLREGEVREKQIILHRK
jgi:hypothetical protein